MKNILVIGGSMFTGRVFSIQASRNGGFNLHVVNRGNFPMALDRVEQYKCDRHDPQMVAELIPDIHYDALVDFCAYTPGEIRSVVDALGSRIRQYIFFSTSSIYLPAEGYLDEESPFIDLHGKDGDVVNDYIRNKIILEQELAESCGNNEIGYTILRPSFIYGPFNYAPRESFFIELIAKKRAVPVPVDATARFCFVYVLDIAQALMKCIGDKKAYGEAFNLADEEAVTYSRLISCFEHCNKGPFDTREVTVEQAEKEQLPLPFPLTGDTLYDSRKFSHMFDFGYTPLTDGMEKTFNIFYSLYTS